MVFKYIKRFVFYGGITAILTLPIAYKLGYNKGALDTTIKNLYISRLERIADDKFKVTNPDNHKNYIIDFHSKRVIPYSPTLEDKRLEELFSK